MLRKTAGLAALFTIALLGAAFAADDEHEGNQTKCPVMGNKINKEVYTDYKGQRVFFCCAGCIDPFNKDPEAYLKKMKEDGVEPMKLKAQSICPVSGEELTGKDVYADHEGQRVYFCCPSCKKAFAADPPKYLKVLSDRGETPEILHEPAEEDHGESK